MDTFSTLSTEPSSPNVVHVHLGDRLPAYFWDTMRQTRRFHTGNILCVVPVADLRPEFVQELALTVIPNDSFDGDEMVRAVNQTSWLDRRYGGGGFWHYTLLRLFVVESVMRRYEVDSCLHLENDVAIYRSPSSIWPALKACYGQRCAVAPLGPTSGCTAAVMYVGSHAALDNLCRAMLQLLTRNERDLLDSLGADMVNEMVLLGIVRLEHPEWLDVLPVSPHTPRKRPSVRRVFKPWARPFLRLADHLYPKILDLTPPEELDHNLEAIGLLFDPAFWGQYIGGTPHGDGPGFSASHHWIGNDLRDGRYGLQWEVDEAGRRIPFVLSEGEKWPLFNLHIHCKRINEFV